VGEDELEAGRVRDPVRQLRDEVVAAWNSSEKSNIKLKTDKKLKKHVVLG